MQSVLSRALLRWRHISNYENVDAYLRRALINERTSQWRRWGRRDAPLDAVAHLRADGDALARTDEREALLGLLRALPRNQRAALVLRFLEDMPDDAIADILSCSASTVRSHIARGLRALRATLDVSAGDPANDHALNGGTR